MRRLRKTGWRGCPDSGTCHHECGADTCFRVQTCEPLSGIYPRDEWPDEVVKEYGGD